VKVTASCEDQRDTDCPRSLAKTLPEQVVEGPFRASSETHRSKRASPITVRTFFTKQGSRSGRRISDSIPSLVTSRVPCSSRPRTPARCHDASWARHLRQLRDPRSRHGRGSSPTATCRRFDVKVRRHRSRAGQPIGLKAHDGTRRRRSSHIHHARRRADVNSGRMVGTLTGSPDFRVSGSLTEAR